MKLITLLLSVAVGCTAFAQAQSTLEFDFEAYNNHEAVLPVGDKDAWDSVQVWAPQIVKHKGIYYMFYTGNASASLANTAIGYATSSDGYHWTKAEANPIFRHNYVGEYQSYPIPVSLGRVLVEDDGTENGRWVMYYSLPNIAWILPTQTIYRATAPSPDGPWSRDESFALEGGERGSWNYHIGTQSVFLVDGEYHLYYTGFEGRNESSEDGWLKPQLGLARSSNGTHFSHYATPRLALAENTIDNAWESYGITSQAIWHSDEKGWEMFYIGHPRPIYTFPNPENSTLHIGYASSADGITWQRYDGNPAIETPETGWPLLGVQVIDGRYFIYHDHGWGEGISLLTGTISQP